MKIVQINLGLYGSTAKVMLGIEQAATSHQFKFVYPELSINMKNHDQDILIKGIISRKVNHFLEKVTGYQGCFSYFKTIHILKQIKKFDPDIIHLHNIHCININYNLLFRYIKKNKIKTIWTLHDCWSFTGQCPHFTLIDCQKWQSGCHDCEQYREYPDAFVDRTKTMWKLKKKWFTSISDLTIVTPSIWLSNMVKKSYLQNYPIKVINNGIDLAIFKPRKNNFKEQYHIQNKHLILGVSFTWGIKKGLDVFNELAERLDDNYAIVLVGIDSSISYLSNRIIAIEKTPNQIELSKIYSAADVFVNPTREENYPTVNMEALACGTPVITFDTGGSPEIIDQNCGRVVPVNNIDCLINEIVIICKQDQQQIMNSCLNRARSFDIKDKYQDYIDLYESLKKGEG
ncbi:MAG: glycosyltransferase [Thomasclavelia sp.]